jgi:Protein of unknown function (DUF5131)
VIRHCRTSSRRGPCAVVRLDVLGSTTRSPNAQGEDPGLISRRLRLSQIQHDNTAREMLGVFMNSGGFRPFVESRPQNILKMLPPDWGDDGYRNVWLGVTAEDQEHFDQRWQRLQKIPATVRFISYEPAIGPLRLPKSGPLPDWLISGGESGGRARPVNPRWVRDIIADCRRIGVAIFHKQWGSYANNPLVVEQGMSCERARRLFDNE